MNPEIVPTSLSEFERQIVSVKPRFFDTYVLAPFLMYYAYKSKSMNRTARRILFGSGIYMVYRNYSEYKKLATTIRNQIPRASNGIMYQESGTPSNDL